MERRNFIVGRHLDVSGSGAAAAATVGVGGDSDLPACSSLSMVSSTSSSTTLPIDFGESLPPNLTTLVNKQFKLYRLRKSEEESEASAGK